MPPAAAADYNATTRTTTELLSDLGDYEVRRCASRRKRAGRALRRLCDRAADDHEHGDRHPRQHRVAPGCLFRPGPDCRRQLGTGAGRPADRFAESGALGRGGLASQPFANGQDECHQHDPVGGGHRARATPTLPLDPEDPVHLAYENLALLLFYAGGASSTKGVLAGNDLVGIDRSLLYPAIRAVAACPIRLARSSLGTIYPSLSDDDLNAVAGAVVDSTMFEAPANPGTLPGVPGPAAWTCSRPTKFPKECRWPRS